MNEYKPKITWDGSQPIVGPYEVRGRVTQPNSIQFHGGAQPVEIMRLSQTGIWTNPNVPVDDAAAKVLEALDTYIKVMVGKAVANERESCAKLVENYTGAWSDEGFTLVQAIRSRGTTK